MDTLAPLHTAAVELGTDASRCNRGVLFGDCWLWRKGYDDGNNLSVLFVADNIYPTITLYANQQLRNKIPQRHQPYCSCVCTPTRLTTSYKNKKQATHKQHFPCQLPEIIVLGSVMLELLFTHACTTAFSATESRYHSKALLVQVLALVPLRIESSV